MNTRVLNLAIHLLLAACTGIVVVPLTACCPPSPWHEPKPVDLGLSVDLRAVVTTGWSRFTRDASLAVGEAGTVVIWVRVPDGRRERLMVSRFTVGDRDLNDVATALGSWWVVGDGGFAAVSEDEGETWTELELGVTANLHAIVQLDTTMMIVGDGVVLLRQPSGTWVELPAPDGGWGDLRAARPGYQTFLVGLGGVAWSSYNYSNPNVAWVAEPTGSTADLLEVTYGNTEGEDEFMAFAADGSLLTYSDTSGWSQGEFDRSLEVVDASESFILAADGTLYRREFWGNQLFEIGTFPGALALGGGSYDSVVIVGADGMTTSLSLVECEGGRPFVVDGVPLTASACAGERWSRPVEGTRTPPSALGDSLARAWIRDGLYEHASIASFARFALELLALGAPPQLVRDVQMATVDELRHAKLCFGLARRFGQTPVEPGALPLGPGTLARSGDPVATALALFEEGCLNESLAACEAAAAADRCEDPGTRQVLLTIAADERRHAIAAWAALRWIVASYGDRVRDPLRARLARLETSRPSTTESLDPALERWGRLTGESRAIVHRRVLAEVVRPLGYALVERTQLADRPAKPC